MGGRQEAIVRDFCGAWGEGRREFPDIDKIISMTSDDAVWETCVPGGRILRGRQAWRDDIIGLAKTATFMECGIKTIVCTGRTVVTERLDHFIVKGKRIDHALVALYDLDEAGLITNWREYYDKREFNKQFKEL